MIWKGLEPVLLLQHEKLADVAYGSVADITALNGDVRYTPESGQTRDGRFVRLVP